MLKIRIIPCLDVKDGRVVKGVNFVDLVDAGDPVAGGRRLRRGRRRRALLSRHHREPREPRHHLRHRRATAERCFMPLTVGGGVRTTEDIRKLLAGRRRQGVDQYRRRHRREFVAEGADNSAPSASSSPSTPSGCRRPGEAPRWEIFTHGGRNPTGLDAVNMPARW